MAKATTTRNCVWRLPINPRFFFALLCLAAVACRAQNSGSLRVTVLDAHHQPIPAAKVAVNGLPSSATDDHGEAIFSNIRAGTYDVAVSKPGFRSEVRKAVTVPAALEVTLSPVHRDEVTVQGTADSLEPAAAAKDVNTAAAKQLPSRPATVSDALPLVPGITRSPQGGLNISGSGEQRSALIVNSADVTDPATGQFGTTIPIDSVETLSVLQTPYQAEYGRFTSALVSVETKRGGDKWKAELNDPLPDFRIRSYHLRGIRDATPRLNFEGPLLKNKLFFSEGFEYEVRKTEVITLPFPSNQQLKQGLNSFSQLDYIVSSTHLLTATFHLAPTQLENVNLSTFNPKPATPDASLHDYTGTLGDRLTLSHGDLLENTFSYTRFIAYVWPHGPEDLIITPSGNEGNYFAQQQRDSARLSFASTDSLHTLKLAGEHHVKVGAYFAPSSENGQIVERPFEILDSQGNLLEQVIYTGGAPVLRRDTEIALFAQDHWLLTRHFAVDAGLRTESQELTETFRLAPRAGFAWSPLGDAGPTVRAGAGVFYDRVPLDVFSFAQYPNQVVTTYPSGIPITYLNALGEVVSRDPFLFHENKVGDFSPRSSTWSFQLDQQFRPWLKLKASYVQNVSAGLIIMNPIAPASPDASGTMLLTGNGQARYHQLEISGRLRFPNEKHQLYFSYVKSLARGDLNDFSNYLGSFPVPIIRPNQFGNLPADIPNRFLVWGLIHLPWKFQIAPIFEWRTGLPYSITDAAQAYVGIPDSQRFPNFLSLDARLSKDFKVSAKYSVRFSVSANNSTNHFNPDSVYSNTDAPLYGQFLGQHKRRFMVDFDFLF
jgi:hypothetical protein